MEPIICAPPRFSRRELVADLVIALGVVLAVLAFLGAILLLPAHGWTSPSGLGAAIAPGIGSAVLTFVLAHLTAGVIVGVLGFLGARFLSVQRERQVALAIYYGAHMAADIDLEMAPGGAKTTAEKIASYLKSADDYCLAHGWRALKPGEQLAATAQAQALVGGAKMQAAQGIGMPLAGPR